MKQVLVLCTGNSCRSQMAEGYLRFYGEGKAEFFSAGSHPTDLHPIAVKVMAEDNIDIAAYTAKNLSIFEGNHFDYIINMCEEVSTQIPASISADAILHHDIPDPSLFEGTPKATLSEFRRVREIIKTLMLKFIGSELSEKKEAILQ
ncbi:MAG: arsenate reductase ArsC [Saprospiraceae bacterium]|nr:arsenate reductase ArsC [Saprospiraceae bacterium]